MSVARVLAVGSLLALGSCYRAGVEYRSGRDLPGLQGASVVVSSDASYRLIVNPSLREAPSRLWAVHARIETFDDAPMWINHDGIQLLLDDGTRARTLDQPRVAALLNRTQIGAGNLTYSQTAVARPATAGLSNFERTRLRGEILSTPLAAGELTRSRPIEGYMVVDVKQELASLEGAVLEVVATRLSDGTFVRRTHRFPTSHDGLRAGATSPGHRR